MANLDGMAPASSSPQCSVVSFSARVRFPRSNATRRVAPSVPPSATRRASAASSSCRSPLDPPENQYPAMMLGVAGTQLVWLAGELGSADLLNDGPEQI